MKILNKKTSFVLAPLLATISAATIPTSTMPNDGNFPVQEFVSDASRGR